MGQYSIVDARINLAKCEYSMLYVFYEMGWRDSASLCLASPLAHSDKSKFFQNFAALRRTPELLLCKRIRRFGSRQHSYRKSPRIKNLGLFLWLGLVDTFQELFFTRTILDEVRTLLISAPRKPV